MAIKSCFKTKSQKFSVDYNQLMLDVLEKQGTISACFHTFHNYSINNQFLAYHQMVMRNIPLSPINSFTGWNKLNRSINKGEKAIYLWQPVEIKEKVKDDKTGEIKEAKKIVFTFKPKWFALSQTNGENVEPEKIEMGNFNFKNVYKEFKIELVPFEKLNGNVQGYANTKERKLAINPIAEDVEMTILHEVAHIVLKHYEGDLDSSLKELEAETTAYIVGSVLELSEKQLANSRGYVQDWFKENKIPEKNAKRIMAAAQKILTAGFKK